MAKNEEKINPIYLCDGSILPWERPVKGISTIDMYNGKTTLRGVVGWHDFKEDVDNFRVVASAVQYLADVIALPSGVKRIKGYGEPVEGIARSVHLFQGNVTIYQQGTIPGTEIAGFDLVADGKIWKSVPIADHRYHGRNALRQLVMGCECGDSSIIKQVIRGFDMQKHAREQSDLAIQADAYQRGERDGNWSGRRSVG